MVIIPTLIVLIDNLKDSSINSTVNKYTLTVSIVTLISSIITLISGIITLFISKLTLIVILTVIINVINIIVSVFIIKLCKKRIINRKIAIVCCKVFFLFSIFTLICSAVILFGNEDALSKGITNSDEKETLIKTIVTLIGIIVAFLSGMYTTMKSNKATLSSESLWREGLMNVASKEKIGKDDLLRLRASQRYSYAKKKADAKQKADDTTKSDSSTNKDSNSIGDKVRNKIGHITNELYIRCILNEKELSKKDVNTIRNLAIALLKYDYIKRGDNVKLTHYIIRELEEDDEYANLLNWINNEIKEIDVDKHKKK